MRNYRNITNFIYIKRCDVVLDASKIKYIAQALNHNDYLIYMGDDKKDATCRITADEMVSLKSFLQAVDI